MIKRVLLSLCCLVILVIGSGCYVYTYPSSGYYGYPYRPRYHYYSPYGRYHHHSSSLFMDGTPAGKRQESVETAFIPPARDGMGAQEAAGGPG